MDLLADADQGSNTGGGILRFTLSLHPTDPGWKIREPMRFSGVLRHSYPANGSLDMLTDGPAELTQETRAVMDKILVAEIKATVSRWSYVPVSLGWR